MVVESSGHYIISGALAWLDLATKAYRLPDFEIDTIIRCWAKEKYLRL